MKFFLKAIIIFLFLFQIQKSFAAMVTKIDDQVFQDAADGKHTVMGGPEFNKDGTKMYVSYHNGANLEEDGDDDYIAEYNLSTPFDISTATYAGDSERCNATDPNHDGTDAGDNATTATIIAFKFSDDGKKIFTAQRGMNTNPGNSFVNRYDLTTPFDVSTCTYVSDVDVDTAALQNGTNAGDRLSTNDRNNLQGIEITNDGTKLFVTMNDATKDYQNIKQYNFGTPYDLSTITLASTAIVLGNFNPFGMAFSADGKRLFQSIQTGVVEQYSLDNAFDLSSSTKDGEFNLKSLDGDLGVLIGIAFSSNGLKLFAVHRNDAAVYEFSLSCPFTVVGGNCPSIKENKDRTGILEAQVDIAKRNIEYSTDSALNRLRWIRRNKEKQNLTNHNINFEFSNPIMSQLVQKISASNTEDKQKKKNQDVFYWSEGSISLGKIGDSGISSSKEISTDALTFGFDKFIDEKSLSGFAFKFGKNDTDVGSLGSNLDTDTYNVTFYNTSSKEDDTKFIDTILGFGKLNYDMLSVVDGINLTAEREGYQLYGAIRAKDEIKKDNLMLIPSVQLDLGYSFLNGYVESGAGAISVDSQDVRTNKLRAAISLVEDLSKDDYVFKTHSKFEYSADLARSSNFKYSYASDSNSRFSEKLSSGALHNLSGELGLDMVLKNNFSVFLIYEREQAIGYGHTDQIHIAIGYLPDNKVNYALKVDAKDDLRSKVLISKKIGDYKLSFDHSHDFLSEEDNYLSSINLSKDF